MAPSGEQWKKSGISRKYPSYRNNKLVTVQSWFKGKRKDDEAEGLWRIHDDLYDLEKFITGHPGGAFWIEQTRGTDITEAFEAHHISTLPEQMLKRFKVREAANPRNITLTLKPDGFYRTLKSRIREKLKEVDYSPSRRSNLIHTALLIATFVLAIATAIFESRLLAILGGLALCWTVISSHNYFHRRDNWRMYAFNLGFMNFNDWRVSHAMSHHIYTNSYHDLELSMFEPFLCWLPNPYIKNFVQRYVSWFYGPLVYAALFKGQIIKRIVFSLTVKNVMYWNDLIGLSIPLAMFVFSDLSLFMTFKMWLLLLTAASFIFSLIGLNAAHHAPSIHHDGDADRDDRDWGLFQLDTIMDRSDIKGSQFLVLTHFGDHALHHLFPTLDHGILPQLYPILYETMDEFKGQLTECNQLHHIIGQHKQLARITPNKIPPGSKKLK